MAIVNPTPPTTPPALPQRADRATFSSRVDAGFTWFKTAVTEVYGLAQNAVNNATEALGSANAASTSASTATAQANLATAQASAAAALTNALPHDPATNYALGQPAISNVNFQSYRRKSAGSSATDPSNDSTNWEAANKISNGLSNVESISSSLTLNSSSARLQVLTPTVGGLDVVLPPANQIGAGKSVIKIKNTAGGIDLGIADNTNNPIGFLRAVDEVSLDLHADVDASGVWGNSSLQINSNIKTLGAAGATTPGSHYEKYRSAKLSATTGVIAYLDYSSNVNVAAINLGTGDYGAPAPAQVDAASNGTSFALFPLNATQALLVYQNTKMKVLTVNTGDYSVSYGSPYTLAAPYGLFYPSVTGGTPNIAQLSATSFLTMGGYGTAPLITCITISGSVISQSYVEVNTPFIEVFSWAGGIVPLGSTKALCTITDSVANGSPFTQRTFVISVSAGVPSFGTVISRSSTQQNSLHPLLPYDATRVVQIINESNMLYARLLTISGTTITASAEQTIRNDSSSGIYNSSAIFQSITHPDAYRYTATAQNVAAMPIGGTYFATIGKLGSLDVFSMNMTTGVITLNTVSLSTDNATYCTHILTDTGYLLQSLYTNPNISIKRILLNSSGSTVQSTVNITTPAGSNVVYTIGGATIVATMTSTNNSISLSNNGSVKGRTPFSNGSYASAIYGNAGVNLYPLQFTSNGRLFSTQTFKSKVDLLKII